MNSFSIFKNLALTVVLISNSAFAHNLSSFYCSGAEASSYEPFWMDLDFSSNNSAALTFTTSYIDSGSGERVYEKKTLSQLECRSSGEFVIDCISQNDPTISVKTALSQNGQYVSLYVLAPSFAMGYYEGVPIPFTQMMSCKQK